MYFDMKNILKNNFKPASNMLQRCQLIINMIIPRQSTLKNKN
jgi:hypothetical protein